MNNSLAPPADKGIVLSGPKPKSEFGSFPLSWSHLQLQHQVHPLLSQWVDIIQNQGDDNINAIGLMRGNAVLQDINKNTYKETKKKFHILIFFFSSISVFWYLVFMAGALTVLSQTLQGLVNEGHVLLVDVEAQEAEAPRGAATDTVQELQGLTHKIVIVLVILAAEEVLVRYKKKERKRSLVQSST